MFEQVKQEIDDKIKTNGNNEITATRLNGVLQNMMDAAAEEIEDVAQSAGDQVEANPEGDATTPLNKIKIGETIYKTDNPFVGEVQVTDAQRLQALANISNQEAGYDSSEPPVFTGKMGYVVLQPQTDDKTTFAAQIANKPNTIFEIRDVFDLNGAEVTIPANCTLKFEGGKILNGTIQGNNTSVDAAPKKIFSSDTTFSGTWRLVEAFPEWFDAEDDSINIVKGYELCGVVKLLSNKTYNIRTQLIIKGGQLLKGDNEVRGYEGVHYANKPIFNVTIPNGIILASGSTIDGVYVQYNGSSALGDNEYLVGLKYSPDLGVQGVPNGCNILNCYFENAGKNINTACGICIKGISPELYNVNISGTGIRAFEKGLEADISNFYIFNFLKSRFDYCRHLFTFNEIYDAYIDFTFQGSSTSIEEGTEEALIAFNELNSTCYIDGYCFDCFGVDVPSSNKYYFKSIIKVETYKDELLYRDITGKYVFNKLIFGPLLRSQLGGFLTNEYPSNYVYSDVPSMYLEGSYHYGIPSKFSNIFASKIKGVDYSIDHSSDGFAYIGEYDDSVLFSEKIDSIGKRCMYKLNSAGTPTTDGYFEINFPAINKIYTDDGSVTVTRQKLYDICATFNIGSTPKAVKYTIVLLNPNSLEEKTANVMVLASSFSIEDCKDTYAGEIDDNTIYFRENMGEFSIRNLLVLRPFANPSISDNYFIKSVCIKALGQIGNNVQLLNISGTTNISHLDNLLVRPNRWFGNQGFDGIVRLNGNMGDTNPSTGLTEGLLWYNKQDKKWLTYNGTEFVNIDGTPEFQSEPEYLKLTATEDSSSVTLTKVGTPPNLNLEYAINGASFANYTIGTQIDLNNGDYIEFRHSPRSVISTLANNDSNYYKFVMTGKIAASGNIMSLLDAKCESLTCGNYCFNGLFYGCTSLISAPLLPATSLGTSSYRWLFYGDTNLEGDIIINAATIGANAQAAMFFDCDKVNSVTFNNFGSGASNVFGNNNTGNSTSYIQINAATPPVIISTTLVGLKSDCIIYVPDDSVDAYKADEAEYWSARKEYIKGISEKPNE